MSVYIKGMEMPTDCISCPFCDYEQGLCLAANDMDTAPREIGKRHKDCPLVPVPDHGDLIERDALRNTMFIGEQCLYSWDEVEDAIDFAPTIIPADKDGAE